MNLIKAIENDYLKDNIEKFNVGDTVKVHVKVVEGKRERIQIFEGIVIKGTERRHRKNIYGKKNFLRRRR